MTTSNLPTIQYFDLCVVVNITAILLKEMDCEHYQWGQDPESTGPLGIDYIYLDNCLFPHAHAIVIIIMFFWVIFLINQMATTASDYFSPTLGLVCDKLNLAYDIAGVTFLALGNGAPDFFSFIASVSGGIDILVAMGASLGGEMFIATVVVGTIAILCPCELSSRIFLRDAGFFLLAVTCVTIIGILGYVPFWLAMVYISLYFVYVLVVAIGSWFGPNTGGGNRKMVDVLSGDIGLTRFDADSIQTAFWHKDAVAPELSGSASASASGSGGNGSSFGKATTSSASTAFKSGSSSNAPGGYQFMILSEEDEDGAGNKALKDAENGIINISGGYAPPLELIIKEDYCNSVHVHPENGTAAYTIQHEEYDDDDDNDDINGGGVAMNPLSTSDSLETSLLSGSRSESDLGDDAAVGGGGGGGVGTRGGAPKVPAALRGKNKSRYQALVTSLYWQQWMVRRRFQKSAVYAEWSTYPLWRKVYVVCDYPVTALRDLTIPTLNNDNWSKFNAVAHPIIDPIFVAFLFGYLGDSAGGMPVWLLCIFISIVPAASLYLLTHHGRAPSNPLFSITWTLGAFFMCIVWIYILAGELMTCLSALGTILGIPPAFLGLTVLAWGNSMGDFFTNTSVAKQGLGEMAIAGCYGGPVFNLLMGMGCALAFASLQTYPAPFPVKLDLACIVSLVFLYVALISTVAIVASRGYKIERTCGMYLISLYAVYSVCQLIIVVFFR
jgi:Ca2+/Na+ antiporter